MTGAGRAGAGVALAAVIAVAVAIVARSMTDDDEPSPAEPGSTTADSTVPTAPAVEDPDLPASAGIAPVASPAGDCPIGHDCQTVEVRCATAPVPTTATIATGLAEGPRRGVLVLFSGGAGDTWWDADADAGITGLARLRAAGIDTVQVRWVDGWSFTGGQPGPGHAGLGCRPATILLALHDHLWIDTPAGQEPVCGFCATGNSGGSTQVALALGYHGADAVLDGALLTSGPPHAGLASGCLAEPGDEAFGYDTAQARDVDAAFGLRPGGPCERHDGSFRPSWDANDPAGPEADLEHPATKVVVILGERDDTVAVAHARVFVDAVGRTSTAVTETVVAEMGHRIERSPNGVAALVDAVLAD